MDLTACVPLLCEEEKRRKTKHLQGSQVFRNWFLTLGARGVAGAFGPFIKFKEHLNLLGKHEVGAKEDLELTVTLKSKFINHFSHLPKWTKY